MAVPLVTGLAWKSKQEMAMLATSKKILTIALTAVALTTVSIVVTTQANACPNGYFQCGGACDGSEFLKTNSDISLEP
jgi:hypothetical protein